MTAEICINVPRKAESFIALCLTPCPSDCTPWEPLHVAIEPSAHLEGEAAKGPQESVFILKLVDRQDWEGVKA